VSALTPPTAPRVLYVFGAGGMGREVAWLADDIYGATTEVVFVVDQPGYLVGTVNGLPVRLLSDVDPGEDTAFVAAVGDPLVRRAAVEAFARRGMQAISLVHPRVERSDWVEYGPGSVISAGVILTTNVQIGSHVLVNIGCTISHDARIHDFATLSPGVNVAGNVTIEANAFIGIGASITNGEPGQPLTIGEGAVVAAGSCVRKSVEAGAMVAGVPATRRK
jgi:sugar O-acyltransferase (sialic acid O-acetyltransferase NeuD family)